MGAAGGRQHEAHLLVGPAPLRVQLAVVAERDLQARAQHGSQWGEVGSPPLRSSHGPRPMDAAPGSVGMGRYSSPTFEEVGRPVPWVPQPMDGLLGQPELRGHPARGGVGWQSFGASSDPLQREEFPPGPGERRLSAASPIS